MRLDDLTGRRFNHLVVISRAPDRVTPSGSKSVAWNCVCDCGKQVTVRSNELRRGTTKSCGCYRSAMHTTHGKRHSRLYNIWQNMVQRCTNDKNPAFRDYGQRGITVCEEWRNSFQVFESWAITAGYSDSLSIDRIDNDNGYKPSNCRWVTAKVQANNRRPRKRGENRCAI